jgi:hypothetical protein
MFSGTSQTGSNDPDPPNPKQNKTRQVRVLLHLGVGMLHLPFLGLRGVQHNQAYAVVLLPRMAP